MSVSFDKTVAAMSHADMELLIRAYIRRHVHNTGGSYSGRVQFQLVGEVNDSGKDAECRWTVTGNYENATKGEILAVTAREFYRRVGWMESSEASLRLISGTVEGTTPPTIDTDEVTF